MNPCCLCKITSAWCSRKYDFSDYYFFSGTNNTNKYFHVEKTSCSLLDINFVSVQWGKVGQGGHMGRTIKPEHTDVFYIIRLSSNNTSYATWLPGRNLPEDIGFFLIVYPEYSNQFPICMTVKKSDCNLVTSVTGYCMWTHWMSQMGSAVFIFLIGAHSVRLWNLLMFSQTITLAAYFMCWIAVIQLAVVEQVWNM